MLVLNRGLEQTIEVHPAGVVIHFLGFSREGQARIGITAPQNQEVMRGELAKNWVPGTRAQLNQPTTGLHDRVRRVKDAGR